MVSHLLLLIKETFYSRYSNFNFIKTDKEWANMEHIFFRKTPLFLKFQGLSILKNTKRHNWTPEDDELLKKYVGYFVF